MKEGSWKSGEKKMLKTLEGYQDVIRVRGIDQELPPRGNKWVDRLGLVPGLVLDFTQEVWDFNEPMMATKAETLVRDKRALLIVTSPTCGMQGIGEKLKAAGIQGQEALDYKKRHVDWCARLCKLQLTLDSAILPVASAIAPAGCCSLSVNCGVFRF